MTRRVYRSGGWLRPPCGRSGDGKAAEVFAMRPHGDAARALDQLLDPEQCRPPDNDVEQPCEDHESHQDGPSSPNEWADRAGGGLNLVDRVLLRHFYCTIVLAHDTERVVGNARVRVVVAPVTEHAQPRLLKLVSLRAGLSGCPVETSDGVAVVPQPRLRDRAPGAAHPDGVVGPAPGHAAVLQQLPHKRHQRGVLARRLRLSQVIVTAPPPCLFRAQSEAQKLNTPSLGRAPRRSGVFVGAATGWPPTASHMTPNEGDQLDSRSCPSGARRNHGLCSCVVSEALGRLPAPPSSLTGVPSSHSH
eukprot:CAMPEP_0204603612 /NCGR_PEP_ID=MMETSP0661-20131031/57373_1 /ASSEMBLY_ACC=CAM_ASM_000606 /TAXON_ID=109239 /ORGANISM="Alexandrium margalefi, Strain AMGDE01CS-322" /LENGTH=303 /DNA_ID=CAMNT_0051614689 /DNA_START=214 /DNA_END=1124 /DNA_ORIENTATION=+